MFVFCRVALLCSPIILASGLGAPASASEVGKRDALAQSMGCGSDCIGTCFAGNCLYAPENVDEDTIVDNTMRQGKPAWAEEASRMLSPLDAEQSRMRGLPQPQVWSPQALPQLADSAALAQAEAEEARLQAENAQLRRQLAQWKETGSHIAEREAKVVEILSRPRAQSEQVVFDQAFAAGNAPSSQIDAPSATVGTSFLQQVARRSRGVASDVKDSVSYRLGGSYTQWFVLAVVAIMMYSFWRFGMARKTEAADGSAWQTRMAQALTGGPCGRRFQPLMRKIGWSEYKVEVSEIHLGSFFAGSYDVRVTFRMANGSERRTKVLRNSGGAFLRFDDVVELAVPNKGAPCIISVGDRQGNVAQIEVSGSELIRLVHRPHQEYFRTELKPCRHLSDSASRRPYIAMRLRDVTTTADAEPAAAAPNSFAV